MIGKHLEDTVDRVIDALWSHELRDPCELRMRDVELVVRAYQVEKNLSDILYNCLMGVANGQQIAAAVRLYHETRTP